MIRGSQMEKINNLIKSKFVRNVFIMATGTIGAQVVNVLASPIITRMYGPEAFGVMGTFSALTQIIIPVAALTYPIAIVLPKNDKNAKGLMKLSLYITLFIALITTTLLLLFNESIVSFFKIQDLAPFLYLIPLVITFAGIMQIIEQWLIRTNQFSINAKASFWQAVLTNGSKVGIGLIYPAASVLVVIQALGSGVKALIMFFLLKVRSIKKIWILRKKICH